MRAGRQLLPKVPELGRKQHLYRKRTKKKEETKTSIPLQHRSFEMATHLSLGLLSALIDRRFFPSNLARGM